MILNIKRHTWVSVFDEWPRIGCNRWLIASATQSQQWRKAFALVEGGKALLQLFCRSLTAPLWLVRPCWAVIFSPVLG